MRTMTLREAIWRSLAAEVDGSLLAWLSSRRAAEPARVETIEFDRMRGWSLDPAQRRLVHSSGRFFSVLGVEAEVVRASMRERVIQPLIGQSERGLLGVLMRIVEGRVELLVQAKREPGDPRGAQLAPTVQATLSNSSRVHGGRSTRGLERFTSAAPSSVVFDAALPEQADLFLAKLNRNMVVQVDDAPEFADEADFRWATLAELSQLLREPEAVNMSLRSLLACVAASGLDVDLRAAASTRAWLAEFGARTSWRITEHPLDRLPGWRWDPHGLIAEDEPAVAGLRVVYVDVHAPGREVASWTQPMLARHDLGLVDLCVRRHEGTLEVALQATLGPGQAAGVRLGATRHAIHEPQVAELARLGGMVHFDATLAEDGGRLLAIRHRYRVLEVECDSAEDTHWIGLAELPVLLGQGVIDIEARTGLAALVLACPDLLAG